MARYQLFKEHDPIITGAVTQLLRLPRVTTLGIKATLYSIQPSTRKSTSRRHGIQAVTRVMAYVADAVTL
jgi:hypothetical protein